MEKIHGFTYQKEPYGIDAFHAFLMNHPQCLWFSHEVWSILFCGFRFAESAHKTQKRKADGSPYIGHPIHLVQTFLQKYEKITDRDILVLILHDTLEDHPALWKMILDRFGLDIFRDVLALTTGGIPMKVREKIWTYLDKKYPDWIHASKGTSFLDIRRLLSPASPIFKLHNESRYQKFSSTPESQKIENAILYYGTKLLGMSHDEVIHGPIDPSEEYIGLGNYLYFTKEDAQRKLSDMLHNMSDMEHMEKTKPWYIEKRRIKAYILWVKLKNMGMKDEYSQLVSAFQSIEKSLPTDADVISEIS